MLIVETLVPETPGPHFGKSLDIIMLAVTGGRERTAAQHAALLAAAGFRLARVLPTASQYSIVEARLRSVLPRCYFKCFYSKHGVGHVRLVWQLLYSDMPEIKGFKHGLCFTGPVRIVDLVEANDRALGHPRNK